MTLAPDMAGDFVSRAARQIREASGMPLAHVILWRWFLAFDDWRQQTRARGAGVARESWIDRVARGEGCA